MKPCLARPVQTSRRSFLAAVFTGVACCRWEDRLWAEPVAAQIQPYSNGLLIVKLSEFNALTAEGGLVGLDYGEFHPVLITKSEGSFHVLQGICPHAAGRVVPAVTQLFCTNHGSQFDLSGTSFAGPAIGQSLPAYSFFHNSTRNQLEIQVPDLAYRVTAFALSGADRLALTFETKLGYRYEVRFRADIEAAESVIAFSTTSNGVMNSTEIMGDGNQKTLYLPRNGQKGFYTANVKVSTL